MTDKNDIVDSDTQEEPVNPLAELQGKPPGLLAEFWHFIKHEKVWWMAPIILVLLFMIGFIVWVEASPVLPFIYTL
jgi:hypothetical protein